MWTHIARLIGAAGITVGMAVNAMAAAVSVYDTQTGSLVTTGVSLDASVPAPDQLSLTFTNSAQVTQSLSVSASATTVAWTVSAQGDYMANAYDLTIKRTIPVTITRSGFGDLLMFLTPIETWYASRTDTLKPLPAEFKKAALTNGTEDLAVGPDETRHEWMRLKMPTLPATGSYTNTATITIGPKI